MARKGEAGAGAFSALAEAEGRIPQGFVPGETSRWLTFDEMVDLLRVKPLQLMRLIRQGRILGICVGRKHEKRRGWRYLDPGPKLRLVYHNMAKLRSGNWKEDVSTFPILSTAEFAALCGYTVNHIHQLMHRGRLKPLKIGRYSYFTVVQARDFIFQREKLQIADGRVRMSYLLQWAKGIVDNERRRTVSTADVHADDRLEGELRRLLKLPEPQRAKAVQEFWRRFELVKNLLQQS